MIDIHSSAPYPANVLSNFYPKSFLMDDINFGSIEGFLQGLRCKDPIKQLECFYLCGIAAKKEGLKYPISKKTQTLYYQGKQINRHSPAYKNLVNEAFLCCFEQNEIFRKALDDTKGHELIHSIGKNDPFETILTNDEFLWNLNALRSKC